MPAPEAETDERWQRMIDVGLYLKEEPEVTCRDCCE